MKVILSILIPVLMAVAKALGVDNLTPDLILVGGIVPIVSLLGLIPVIGGSSIAKAVIAVVLGVVMTILKHPAGMTIPLQVIEGIANGLMAAGLWSVGKAAIESVKKPTVV